MIVKMLKYGKSSTKKAINYLLSEKDHLGIKRTSIEVFRGNPELTAAVGDSLKFSSRYNSCVISFSKEENPSDEQLESVLDDFEKISFIGINPSWTAVKHQEDSGAIHLHIVSAKVDLNTGKAYNPAPPGWEKKYQAFKELQIAKFSNFIEPDTKPQLHDFIKYDKNIKYKVALYKHLENAVLENKYSNREECIKYLENFGEITRNGKNYIGFKPIGAEKAIRIKGEIINGTGTNEIPRVARQTRQNKQRTTTKDYTRNKDVLEQCSGRFKGELTKLYEYNQRRYPRTSEQLQNDEKRIYNNVFNIASNRSDFRNIERVDTLGINIKEPTISGAKQETGRNPSNIIGEKRGDFGNGRTLLDSTRRGSTLEDKKRNDNLLYSNEIEKIKTMSEIEKIKQELSLVDFITALGGQVNVIKTSSSSSLIDFENKKFVVSKNNNNYVYFEVNNEKNSGSIVDFYKNNVRNLNFGLIVAELRKFSKGYIPEIKLDNKGFDNTLDYNNFRQMNEPELFKISESRGISINTLKGIDIEIDRFGNSCFLNFGYDEKESKFLPCGYEQKLKDGGKRNIGQKGLWLTGQGFNKNLYLFESAFDALAYKELKGDEGLYCSIGGAMSEKQLQDLKILIKEHKLEVVILGFDNDKAGENLSSRVIDSLKSLNVKIEADKPQEKDWNEDLLREKEKPQAKKQQITPKVDNSLSM